MDITSCFDWMPWTLNYFGQFMVCHEDDSGGDDIVEAMGWWIQFLMPGIWVYCREYLMESLDHGLLEIFEYLRRFNGLREEV